MARVRVRVRVGVGVRVQRGRMSRWLLAMIPCIGRHLQGVIQGDYTCGGVTKEGQKVGVVQRGGPR